jgi:hypothetical protein
MDLMGFDTLVLAVFGWESFWVSLLIAAIMTTVSTAISYATAEKPEGKRNTGVISLPTIDESLYPPIVFGTPAPLMGSQWMWWGWPRFVKLRKNDVTFGHRIVISMSMGICRSGVDGIIQVRYGDWPVWPDVYGTYSTTGQSTAWAAGYCENVYGDAREGGEGGFAGTFNIYYGDVAQVPDANYTYFASSSDVPAFRDIVTFATTSAYIGTLNTVRPIATQLAWLWRLRL